SSLIGVGSYDDVLGDYGKSSIGGFLGSCKGLLSRLSRIPYATLTEKGRVEQEALRVYLRSMIRLLESTAAPSRDPNFYVDESVGAISAILERDTSGKRVEHILSRLSLLPKFLSTARENLGASPRPAVRRAIVRLRASRPLFQDTLAADLRTSGHPAASKLGPGAIEGAWQAVSSFADWLEKERLPKAPEAAPLGEGGWREWLASREETDLGPAQVLAAAEADLGRLREDLRAAASRITSEKAPGALLAEISSGLMEPDVARNAAVRTIAQLWDWMIRERPITPTSDEIIRVRETPAFRRRDAPVRADLPGGYGRKEGGAFLEIAAPDPDWPP
ncbi:MAG: DUF885 family protein, partial [Vicinamibacteria bacterium]